MSASGHGNRQGEHGSQRRIQQRKPAGANKRRGQYRRRRLRYQAHAAVDRGYRSLRPAGIPDSFGPNSGRHARVDQQTSRGAWCPCKITGQYFSVRHAITISHCRVRARTHTPRIHASAGRRRPARRWPWPTARPSSKELIRTLHRLVLRTPANARH